MKINYFKTILFLVLSVSGCFAQGTSDNDQESGKFLTVSENREWLTQFETTSDKVAQVQTIRDKIISDAAYKRGTSFKKEDYWENLVLAENEDEGFTSESKEPAVNCDCKIKFMLVLGSDEYELDAAKFNFVNNILSEIQASRIDAILVKKKFVQDDVVTSGECGTVYLYSEDRSLKRLVRKLLKN